MAERWRRTWQDLATEVVDPGICTGCSGCVVACPQGVLDLDRETWSPRLAADAWYEDQESVCRFGERGCTLCARACPRLGAWEAEADLVRWSRTREADEVLGVYRRIVMVEAMDPAIASVGQDGGLGTAMLLYAIEKGYIDGALVSEYDGEMNPAAGIARTRDELLACAGSRYTYSPNLLAIKQAERSMRLGLISVGCQVSVPAIAKSRGANKLAKRFELVIGLLCSKTFSDRIYDDLLEREYGVARRRITKMNIKGRLQVWYEGDAAESEYLEVPLADCRAYSRPGCSHCPDFAAQHADVSLGGIGREPGRTLTIVRSELGEEIVSAMERDGLIVVTDAVADDPGAVALIEKLAVRQRKRWPGGSSSPDPVGAVPATAPSV
jgi:coenzyme F420 hydrogenase subunit beta